MGCGIPDRRVFTRLHAGVAGIAVTPSAGAGVLLAIDCIAVGDAVVAGPESFGDFGLAPLGVLVQPILRF